MDITEDSINPIINFFHKLLGNNLWILPAALAFASWIVWFIDGSNLYLFTAILCSAIIFLYISTLIYAGIQRAIKSHKTKTIAKRTRELQEKQKQLDLKNEENRHASRIWKLVAHTNLEFVKGAMVLLNFGIHDEDECLRFIQIPQNNSDSTWYKGLQGISKIAAHFEYNLGYGNHVKLIDIIQQKDVIYIQIEAYFYKLLKHFADTENWEKI